MSRDRLIRRVDRLAQPLRATTQKIGNQVDDVVNFVGRKREQHVARCANVRIKQRVSCGLSIQGLQRFGNARQRAGSRDLHERRAGGDTRAKRVERVDQNRT